MKYKFKIGDKVRHTATKEQLKEIGILFNSFNGIMKIVDRRDSFDSNYNTRSYQMENGYSFPETLLVIAGKKQN